MLLLEDNIRFEVSNALGGSYVKLNDKKTFFYIDAINSYDGVLSQPLPADEFDNTSFPDEHPVVEDLLQIQTTT